MGVAEGVVRQGGTSELRIKSIIHDNDLKKI